MYDIALETISHGDGRVDPENLSSFVAAYQTVTVLKLGELWAIPIMLRLALIENLRRVAARIATDRIDRNRADHWADRMTETAEKDPNSLILVVADMARSDPPMVSSFVAELARRLQGQSPALALPLTWIEQRLSQSGLTIEQLVQSENQQQAADQVSISNSIGSLRFLGAMDWREFVETMSVVEATLREDPGGAYGRMDFATRDRYRHVVERIASSSPLSEEQVARLAIQLAADRRRGTTGGHDRAAHVGYYLIDKGLPQLERTAKVRRSAAEALRRIGRPLSAARLSESDPADRGPPHRRPAGQRAGFGLRGWTARAGRRPLAAVRQPVGGRSGELAGRAVGQAALAAADGLLRRDSAGIAHARRDPDDDHERSEHRGSGRGAGGPVPGESGRAPALRPADGLSRRARGNASGGRAARPARAGEDRGAE